MTMVARASVELREIAQSLDEALATLCAQTHERVDAERDYRIAKARAWIQAPQGTVPEREAWVNGQTADLRHRRDLADGLARGAMEAVRYYRGRLSAWQTLTTATREEAALARTGPEVPW